MKFARTICFAAAFLLCVLTVNGQEPQLIDETVARVNSDIITRSMLLKAQKEYKTELIRLYPNDEKKQAEEFGKMATGLLDVLIEDRLVSQRASELSIDVEAELNATILEIAKQANPQITLKEFEEALKEQGVDIEEVRKNYRTQLQRRVILFREVINPIFDKLTDIEKREWYNAHLDAFRLPGEIKLSEIFVAFEGRSQAEAETLAKQAVAEARAGKPFADLVKTYSDPKRGSFQKNGEMPAFKDSDLRSDLRKLVDNMKAGDVSDPIRLDAGFQIISLNEFKPAGVRDFAEVENVVAEQLAFEKSNQQVKDYFKKLKAKAYIKIAEPYKQQIAVQP